MSSSTRLIGCINTAHLLCHYCLLILPTAVLAIATTNGAFGVEYAPILALATGMFVLYGLLSLPQGWLMARFGSRAMIALYFFGTGASLVATVFANSPLALGLVLAAAGGFAAIYHPIGTALLVETAGDRPRSRSGHQRRVRQRGRGARPDPDGHPRYAFRLEKCIRRAG